MFNNDFEIYYSNDNFENTVLIDNIENCYSIRDFLKIKFNNMFEK